MQRSLAHFFSVIFHPLLVPTYGVAIYYSSNEFLFANYTTDLKLFGLLKIFLHTAFFPAFTIGLMVLLKFAKSVQLRSREERVVPFVATGFFLIWAFVVYRRTGELPVLQALLLGAIISVFSSLLINQLFFKISIHTLGMGGLLAGILFIAPLASESMVGYFMLALLAAGLTGTSRLVLQAHEPREVFSGYVLGFAAQMAAFLIIV